MNRPRIAILASGEGTTAEALLVASAEGRIEPVVQLIISNNQNAGIFKRAEALNKKYSLAIKCLHIGKSNYPPKIGEKLQSGDQTNAEEREILNQLARLNLDLIALMGYMKKIGPKIVHEFGWRAEYTSPYQAMMVNTHPGLLPETKGRYGVHVQEHVLNKKLPYGGQTMHIVAEDYDDGPIITEHKVEVLSRDTPESLFDRVKAVEKRYLPKDIALFIKQRIKYLEKRG